VELTRFELVSRKAKETHLLS